MSCQSTPAHYYYPLIAASSVPISTDYKYPSLQLHQCP
ncbi:unnamed protein product, partial [Staurois parvus]